MSRKERKAMYRLNSATKFSILLLIYFFVGIVFTAPAQAPFLSGTASKSTVGSNEQFQISYTLNTSGKNFRAPDFSDFQVLSGPNQSTSMQYVNGSFSQSVTFSFILQPKGEGQFKISPATVEVEGKRIASNVINMTVVKGSAQAQGGNQRGGNGGDESGGLSDKNIFLRVVVNKGSVLEGEAVTVTYKLYTNVQITSYSVIKAPAFNGFWNQDIEVPQPPPMNVETVDGNRYNVAVIKKSVLFPQQSGTLTIDPMELECIARIKVKGQRSNDPFGMFNDPFFSDPFFGNGVRDVKYGFKSSPVKIAVKELPGTAPAGFSGAVGSLSFEAKLDKSETKENEPVNLKIKINGSGNIKLAAPPEINFPPDLETYDPKINESYKASDAGVSGGKTIEYLIIPRHEGDYELPPITFSYYDLNKKQYVSKTEGPFKIKVGRGSGNNNATASGGNEKSEFRLIGKDIRYIKTNETVFSDGDGKFFGSLGFYGLSILPLLAVGGTIVFIRKKRFEESNSVLMRSKKATGMAQKRLASADKSLKAGEHLQVYEEISKALWGYASDKLTIPLSELSKENIAGKLSQRSVSESTVNNFLRTIEDCEMARYGGQTSAANSATAYTSAIELITKIEGEVKA